MRVSALLALVAGLSSLARAETGTVYARSTPPGAQVRVDGSETPSGTAPTVIRDLSPGEHRLRFAFPDGREATRTVQVEANKLTSVSASATEAKPAAAEEPGGAAEPAGGAVVNVISDPAGAELSVDGKTVGKTPCAAGDLAAGTHSFVLKKDGHASYETSLTLKPGETRLLQAKLEPVSPAAKPAEKPSGPSKIAEKDCPYCQGKGHIETMGCPACRRTGWAKKGQQCPKCGGAGTVAAPCLGCRGMGVIGGRACPRCGGEAKPKCPACKGKGKIKAENPDYYKDRYEILTCPYCAGSGLNERSKCKICTGTGTRELSWTSGRWIYKRTVTCWFCKGKGETLPRCQACGGTGVLGSEARAAACVRCCGTGKLPAPCPACKGKGWAKKRKGR